MKDIIVSVVRGSKGRNMNTLYAHAVDAVTEETAISATLDYVVRAAKERGYEIVNAQAVLTFLLEDGQLNRPKY